MVSGRFHGLLSAVALWHNCSAVECASLLGRLGLSSQQADRDPASTDVADPAADAESVELVKMKLELERTQMEKLKLQHEHEERMQLEKLKFDQEQQKQAIGESQAQREHESRQAQVMDQQNEAFFEKMQEMAEENAAAQAKVQADLTRQIDAFVALANEKMDKLHGQYEEAREYRAEQRSFQDRLREDLAVLKGELGQEKEDHQKIARQVGTFEDRTASWRKMYDDDRKHILSELKNTAIGFKNTRHGFNEILKKLKDRQAMMRVQEQKVMALRTDLNQMAQDTNRWGQSVDRLIEELRFDVNQRARDVNQWIDGKFNRWRQSIESWIHDKNSWFSSIERWLEPLHANKKKQAETALETFVEERKDSTVPLGLHFFAEVGQAKSFCSRWEKQAHAGKVSAAPPSKKK